MQKFTLFFVMLLAILFSGCTSKNSTAIYQCEDCNVIMISVDSLRADHLGIYGYSKNTSPNIDALAKESVVFSNAHSASAWTYPSHFSMLTGMYPRDKGVLTFPDIEKISGDYVNIAEVMKEKGYSTAAFAGGAYVSNTTGMLQGFDYFNRGRNFENNAELILEYISQSKNEKFFLFIHGYNVHTPLNPPEELKNKFVDFIPENCTNIYFNEEKKDDECLNTSGGREYKVGLYDAEIFFADSVIGEIVGHLKEEGIYNKTIIIITSDHGETFGEHGYDGHMFTLYEELVRVPLIMTLPGYSERNSDILVSSVDLAPTIINITNSGNLNETDGQNIMGLLNKDEHRILLAATGMKKPENSEKGGFLRVAAFDGNYKMIYSYASGEYFYELYDLKNDTLEMKNIYYNLKYSGITNLFQSEIDKWIIETNLNIAGAQSSQITILDKETEQEIISLGYIN